MFVDVKELLMSQQQLFDADTCSGVIDVSRADVSLVIRFKEPVLNNAIEYLAPSPPDYRESFTGSGLPFANKQQAYQGTPNKGSVNVVNGEALMNLILPNSYYDDFSTIVEPYVDIFYTTVHADRHLTIRLGNRVPYRSLDVPLARTDPMFYSKGWSMPVRTQEQILLDARYPAKNKMADDFWGLKPPA